MYGMGVRGPRGAHCGCAEPPRRGRMRERTVSHQAREIEPVVVKRSRSAQCRPFLTVQKDAERFAACNALSDEIGPLDDPKKAFKLIEEAIGDEVSEVFGVLTLDMHLRMKGFTNTGQGESSSVMAPLLPTLRAAVASGGDYAIIYHVHPSGVVAEPSKADKETTKAFVDAFETIGMPLIDHVIVGGDARKRSYYSFAENKAL